MISSLTNQTPTNHIDPISSYPIQSRSNSASHTTPDDFEFLKLIGEGTTSQVWSVRSKSDAQISALKVIKLNSSIDNTPPTINYINDPNRYPYYNDDDRVWSTKISNKQKDDPRKDIQKLIESEIKTLTKLNGLKADHQVGEGSSQQRNKNNKFVIELKEEFNDLKFKFIRLEYCEGGNLYQHIQEFGVINENRCKLYVGEIGSGLDFIHQSGVIFRDLKTENILICGDGHLKLTDFGLSSFDNDPHPKIGMRRRSICGTPHIIAPEIVKQEEYDHRVDWYSLGCCMYEMLIGKTPFESFNLNRQRQCQAQGPESEGLEATEEVDLNLILWTVIYLRIKLPNHLLSKHSRELLNDLLTKKPHNRISNSTELFQHHWFSNHIPTITKSIIDSKSIKPDFIPSTTSMIHLTHHQIIPSSSSNSSDVSSTTTTSSTSPKSSLSSSLPSSLPFNHIFDDHQVKYHSSTLSDDFHSITSINNTKK